MSFLIKHGYCDHPLYMVWRKMKSRCYYSKNKCYANYGGRGVVVCDEWLNDAGKFVEWALANGWKKGLQLDKDIIPKKLGIEEPLLYSPEYCCFVTRSENNRTKRDSRIIAYNGVEQSLMDWSETIGIKFDTLWGRLNSGWTIKDAFETPVNSFIRLYTYKGETKNLLKWSKELRISYKTLSDRLEKMTIDEAFSTPVDQFYVRNVKIKV